MLHPASKLAAMLRPRSHRFALESRQLFDGAALVEAAHATDAPDAAHAAPAHAEAPHPEAGADRGLRGAAGVAASAAPFRGPGLRQAFRAGGACPAAQSARSGCRRPVCS